VLANETLSLMRLLSEGDTIRVFLRAEMVDRVTEMLDYYLVELVSDKNNNNKSDVMKIVLDPKKYHFTPREWVKMLVEIYLNFKEHNVFLESMIKDERSFEPAKFLKIVQQIATMRLLPIHQIRLFQQLIKRVEAKKSKAQNEEEELGEVPEEFIDPITFVMMDDPVILPSGTTVNRATITRHLLTDQTDPYTRAPCTVEMLKDNVELKMKIDQFKKKMKANNNKEEKEEEEEKKKNN